MRIIADGRMATLMEVEQVIEWLEERRIKLGGRARKYESESFFVSPGSYFHGGYITTGGHIINNRSRVNRKTQGYNYKIFWKEPGASEQWSPPRAQCAPRNPARIQPKYATTSSNTTSGPFTTTTGPT